MCSLMWFVFELHFGLELLTWGEGIKGVATVLLLNLVELGWWAGQAVTGDCPGRFLCLSISYIPTNKLKGRRAYP